VLHTEENKLMLYVYFKGTIMFSFGKLSQLC